jgi:predicted phosphate transport protein (TIGR00153 family)
MKLKMNTILSIFTPRDVKFLPLLKELTEVMVRAASLLHELFAFTKKDQRTEICRLIKVEETKGDKISNRVLKELNNTFITPFDREDINELSDKIEEIIDSINRVALKVMLFSPSQFPEHTVRMTEIIQSGSLEMQEAVNRLDHLTKSNHGFRGHYKKIKALEEEADKVYEKGITVLFDEQEDTRELVKLKDIFQELEKTANKINDAGKVLKTIFVKYA